MDDIALRDREIRLLFLLHNECGAEDIGYNLVRTTIDSAPPYEALSYAWGKELCQITLRNGTVTTLTTNLHHALRYLQRPHASRLLWIDALCINQNDDAERSHQAQLMTQIYGTAGRVLVWLGEAENDMYRSLKILNRGCQAVKALEDQSAPSAYISLTQEEKHLIKQLIDRPYFNRTWVLQETMVAKTALVMWSQFIMDFEALMVACEVLDLAESRWSHFNVACQTIITLGRLRRVFHGLATDRTSLGLTQLLMYTVGKDATDPRDKIFALFGIANKGHEKTPACPDYSRTVEEVYTSVARFLIGEDHSLQILSAVQNASARSFLPSWVPDWRVRSPNRLLDAPQDYLNYRVHGDHLTYPVVTHMPDPNKLALGGVQFDTVRKVYNAGLSLEVVDECDRRLFHSFCDRCTIANTTGYDELYSPTQEDIEFAWLRTISAGLFLDGRHLEPSLARARYPLYMLWHRSDRTSNAPPKAVVEEIFSFVPLWTEGRKVFVTHRGFIGLGPAEVETGDVVCILFGGNLPYVVRHLGEDRFTLMGPSYVHGIMNGEAYHEIDRFKQQTFVLV